MAIDLRDYGWTERHWLTLLEPNPAEKYAGYPFGLQRGDEVAQKVYELTSCQLPYVRADWFVRNASRPPLYHELLGLPKNSETFLLGRGVNVKQRFDDDRLWRAGLTGEKSGVSDHNRIVERFDFLHDGGELIASLPNGLQEYLLAKSNGERINAGPQTIVKDPNEFAGGFDIVNGISCMGCHKHGVITFEDAIRPLYSPRSESFCELVPMTSGPSPRSPNRSRKWRRLTTESSASPPWRGNSVCRRNHETPRRAASLTLANWRPSFDSATQ